MPLMVMLALTTWPLPPALALPCPEPSPISPPGVWVELALAPATTATAAVTSPARAPRRSGVWVAPVAPALCALAVGAAAAVWAAPEADDTGLVALTLPVGTAAFVFLAAPVLAPPAVAALVKVTVEGGAALVSPLRRARMAWPAATKK